MSSHAKKSKFSNSHRIQFTPSYILSYFCLEVISVRSSGKNRFFSLEITGSGLLDEKMCSDQLAICAALDFSLAQFGATLWEIVLKRAYRRIFCECLHSRNKKTMARGAVKSSSISLNSGQIMILLCLVISKPEFVSWEMFKNRVGVL